MQYSKHQARAVFNSPVLRLVLVTALAGGAWTSPALAGSMNSTKAPALDVTASVQKNFTPIGDFASLVKNVSPAVVSVDVHLRLEQTSDEGDSSGNGRAPGFAAPPGFPPDMQFGTQGGAAPAPQPVEAMGSGFLISANGIIVTNDHVVKDAKTVSVTLSNGSTYPAEVLGTDPRTDLAVLQISAGRPLPYVTLGNSADVTPGEWVVAMGNPFGLDGTVTAGIVSALGRDIGDGPYDRFIQIDAPINEGNSGGPLFDQQGQVIGVNTAILSPTGGSVGIGFAIPSDMVKSVVDQLVTKGKVVRGFLGVSAQPISMPVAQAMQLPTTNPADDGALVAAVIPNSPASNAGLQPGDIITKVNGNTVKGPVDLSTDVANIAPGQSVSVNYIRDGKVDNVSIALASLPANPNASNGSENSGQSSAQDAGKVSLGLTLAPLTPEARSELNLPGSASGAVIVDVKPDSLADQAGLQPGDLLVGVGSKIIDGPDNAVATIDAAKGAGASAVALRIVRQGQPIFVGVDLSKKDGNQG